MESFQTIVEDVKVAGKDLVDKVHGLIHEGNIRRVIIKDDKGNTFLEIPITIAAIGVVAAPVLAAVGTLSALAAHFHIVVEKVKDPMAPPPDDPIHNEHPEA